MENPDSNPGTETTNHVPYGTKIVKTIKSDISGSESEINDRVISAVLSELGKRGFSREEFPAAIVIGAAAIQTIKDMGPFVPVEPILAWLDSFRDEMSQSAIRSLQEICDQARK